MAEIALGHRPIERRRSAIVFLQGGAITGGCLAEHGGIGGLLAQDRQDRASVPLHPRPVERGRVARVALGRGAVAGGRLAQQSGIALPLTQDRDRRAEQRLGPRPVERVILQGINLQRRATGGDCAVEAGRAVLGRAKQPERPTKIALRRRPIARRGGARREVERGAVGVHRRRERFPGGGGFALATERVGPRDQRPPGLPAWIDRRHVRTTWGCSNFDGTRISC